MLLVISAQDIKNRKLRSDINITYEEDVFRLIKKFRKYELEIHNVIITQFETSPEVTTFIHKLEKLNIKVIKQYRIKIILRTLI